LARKVNIRRCEIDKSSYTWVKNCASCHPGGGGCEYDRNGHRYDDFAADPKNNIDPMGDNYLDGDYYHSDWANSGVLEADCLVCHLKGYDWQARAQAIQTGLFYEAPAMGAGWYREEKGTQAISPGRANTRSFHLDYERTILADPEHLAASITAEVPDENCCNCHTRPDTIKRGKCWDVDSDVHKAHGLSCSYCHPAAEDHEIAKGDVILGSVRNEQDNTMKGCADCHMKGADDRAPQPDHTFPDLHLETMSCEVCHIPYKVSVATAVIDNATTGNSIRYSVRDIPNHPALTGVSVSGNDSGQSWLPAYVRYKGKIEPINPMEVIWWGDWDKASHRVIPIFLWRIRDFTGARAENGFTITNYKLLETLQGSKEVNTHEEIEIYLRELSEARDRFGCRIAYHTPVLVKGDMIYYLELDKLHKAPLPTAEGGFQCCEPFDLSHNVVGGAKALGSNGCSDCHAEPSPFLNREILVDPFDHKGKPVYREAWEIIGYSRDRMLELSVPFD
jgi:hypothetical protein